MGRYERGYVATDMAFARPVATFRFAFFRVANNSVMTYQRSVSFRKVSEFSLHWARQSLIAALLAVAGNVVQVHAGEPTFLLPRAKAAPVAPAGGQEPWADLSAPPLPAEAHARDGYPNIGYDPSAGVTALKKNAEQEQAKDALRALSAANNSRGASTGVPSFANRLRRLKDTHRADALKQIEGGS